MYGHIGSARLFYDDLNKSLMTRMGFIRNNYDPCTYNKKMVDGYVRVRTHVDDLKILSKSEEQLLTVIKDLQKIYQEMICPMTIWE